MDLFSLLMAAGQLFVPNKLPQSVLISEYTTLCIYFTTEHVSGSSPGNTAQDGSLNSQFREAAKPTIAAEDTRLENQYYAVI